MSREKKNPQEGLAPEGESTEECSTKGREHSTTNSNVLQVAEERRTSHGYDTG